MVSRATNGEQQRPEENGYRTALRKLRPAILGVLAFSALLSVLMLTGSIYMLQVYDRVLSSGSVPTLLGLFSIVVVLYAFFGLYSFLRVRLLSRAALKLDHALGLSAFDRGMQDGLLGNDPRKNTQGMILKDLGMIRKFLSSPAMTTLADMPFVPLFLAVLFLIHAWLGWLTVAGVCVAIVLAMVNRALTKTALKSSGQLEALERDFTNRSRRNAEAIFAMGMKGAVGTRWRDLHHRALARAQSGSDPSEFLVSGSNAFRMLLQSAILTLGALLVLRNEISAGMIIASSILSGRVLAPIDQFIGQWRFIGEVMVAHRRLLDSFGHVAPEPQRIDLPAPTGKITVTGLTKLKPGSPQTSANAAFILSDVTFELDPGDGLGIVGNSASGKSTLARLLTGTMQGDGGEIRFDGALLDQWDAQRLGRHIGYLPQMIEMLPGSIRDNIARFDPEASDNEVIAAARLTGIHDMILQLPEGYGTLLCDPAQPVPLSGGQMQRLGLARAVYGMPSIVVLDEPNSNLDMKGDAALTQAIEVLRAAGSTVVVMTHRPSALTAVNKLMVLDAGMMRVFGDKDEVLAEDYKVETPPAKVATKKLATSSTPVSPNAEPLRNPVEALAKIRAKRRVAQPGRPPVSNTQTLPKIQPVGPAQSKNTHAILLNRKPKPDDLVQQVPQGGDKMIATARKYRT